MSTLILNQVSKHFGGVVAADKVSMQIPPGRITGLIGPNGAGKSTIVNKILGEVILRPFLRLKLSQISDNVTVYTCYDSAFPGSNGGGRSARIRPASRLV